MEEEIWKDIPNYEGYQVSNLGRVRTYNKITKNKLYKQRHWENRILKPIKNISKKSLNKPSYTVCLWKDGKPKKFLIHRMALASQFIGKNKGYISYKLKNNIFHNKKYKWNIIS